MPSYESYAQWKGWQVDFSCPGADSNYFEKEFGNIARPGKRIVEIGFGAGNFLAWGKQKGAEVYGVEIQEDLIAAAVEHGFLAVNDVGCLMPYRKLGFDAVIALDVFEHLAPCEITSMLSSVEKLLKPSGVLIIRVPNGCSPFGLRNQYGDATHVTVITPAKMNQLASPTKMHVVKSRNAAHALSRKALAYRVMKALQYTIRNCVNKVIAMIYSYTSALDQNLIIIMERSE